MTIELDWPRGIKFDEPRMVDFGGRLVPPLGGPVQTIERLGTRHAVAMTLPLMRTEPHGRIWSAKLRLAKLEGALAWFRQDGMRIGAPGTPVVDGHSQTGRTLSMRGFTPYYGIRIGQAFSLIHSGRRYLHFAGASGIVAADGTIDLPIFPMLRVIPDDGDACEFGKPMIEGSLDGNELAWKRLTAPYTDLGTVTILEDE